MLGGHGVFGANVTIERDFAAPQPIVQVSIEDPGDTLVCPGR